MATSAREELFAQLRNDIAAINGVAPYINNIKRVERGMWSITELGVLPAACIVDGGDRPDEQDSTRAAYSVAEVLILVWASRQPGVSPDTTGNSFRQDLRYAMLSPSKIHHNNRAYHCERREFDIIDVQDAPHVGFVETYMVHYSEAFDDPSSS